MKHVKIPVKIKNVRKDFMIIRPMAYTVLSINQIIIYIIVDFQLHKLYYCMAVCVH